MSISIANCHGGIRGQKGVFRCSKNEGEVLRGQYKEIVVNYVVSQGRGTVNLFMKSVRRKGVDVGYFLELQGLMKKLLEPMKFRRERMHSNEIVDVHS